MKLMRPRFRVMTEGCYGLGLSLEIEEDTRWLLFRVTIWRWQLCLGFVPGRWARTDLF